MSETASAGKGGRVTSAAPRGFVVGDTVTGDQHPFEMTVIAVIADHDLVAVEWSEADDEIAYDLYWPEDLVAS